MSIAVVTDSTACIPEYRVQAAGIKVVPVQVNIDGQSFAEGVSINTATVIDKILNGSEVSTSRPAPADFVEVYKSLAASGFREIISIHLSSELSGTYAAAVLAARDMDIPIQVVDSRSVGMGLGFSVLTATDALRSSLAVNEIVGAALSNSAQSKIWFCVENLDQLRRGGRVGLAQATVGAALSIKPILEVESGQILPFEKVRTTGRAHERIVELAVGHANSLERKVQVAVQHAGVPDKAKAIVQKLGKLLPGTPIITTELGAVLTAHVGPGAVAVVVSPMNQMA